MIDVTLFHFAYLVLPAVVAAAFEVGQFYFRDRPNLKLLDRIADFFSWLVISYTAYGIVYWEWFWIVMSIGGYVIFRSLDRKRFPNKADLAHDFNHSGFGSALTLLALAIGTRV